MNPCSEEEYFYKLDILVIRSTAYLRKIFTQRWKMETGEDWNDEPNYIQMFLSQHCRKMINKAIQTQKDILFSSSSSKEWDTSILSLILLHFGGVKKYKLQNQAVCQLRDLRNALAHHKTKKFTQSEYCEKVIIFTKSLQDLGVTQSKIDELIEDSGVSSSLDAIERFNTVIITGEKMVKMKDFESALKQYSEAVTIPRLPQENLGEIYEKRAACYLALKNENGLPGNYNEQALLDADQALKLNEWSWNAFYLKAQCLREKNDLVEAICFYEMAVAISPKQEHVRQEMNSCKLLNDAHKTNASLNPDHLPISLNEQIQQLEMEIEAGCELTIQSVIQEQSRHPAFIGDQYYHGWEVPQNYEKAVKYYTVAGRLGHAEGSYKLARCHMDGHGVKQDVAKGFGMLIRCAHMNAEELCRFRLTPLGFNKWVAVAECDVGQCYEDGLGVEKNLNQTAYWFIKAMKHGLGEAATKMGRLFANFSLCDSLPQSDKMAEMCWKQGMNFKSSVSAEYLVDYYRFQLEPEMAWTMVIIAREMGSSKYLEMSDDQFVEDLPVSQYECYKMEEFVSSFEQRQNLKNKGMTLKQRFLRMEEQVHPTNAQIRTNETSGGQLQQTSAEVMSAVRLKVQSGSKTATQIVKTVEKIFQLNELLEFQNDLSEAYKLKVVNLYYDFMLLQNHLLDFMTNVNKFRAIVAELFNETCETIGDDEMKIRFCYVNDKLSQLLTLSDDKYSFGILKEGLHRYPDNYGYYCIFIQSLKDKKSNEKALQSVNEALEKFPEKQVDLFYEKADILLQSENRKTCDVIVAFETFLRNAPRDHRFVPEAYYAIRFVYVQIYIHCKQESKSSAIKRKKLKLMRKNFNCGKEAEKDQLPCYLPYGVSSTQLKVTKFFVELENRYNVEFDSNGDIVENTFHRIENIIEQKEYLQSHVRTGLIVKHRERLKMAMDFVRDGSFFNKEIFPCKLRHHRVKKMSELKPITLQEMNPTKDKIYEKRILDLTVLEDPNTYGGFIELIVEDENGDTIRVYIDNVQEHNNLQNFQAGCRFAVVNPHMWILETREINGIRVMEPKCVIYLEKVKDMCKFCGEENATYKCSKCKRLYCSEECLKLDQKLFVHSLVCFSISKKPRPFRKEDGQDRA